MIQFLVKLLGRDLSWRLGRSLYMVARGEGLNDIATNSEKLVIDRAIMAAHFSNPRGRMVIIDCGANLGLWTQMACESLAAVGAQGDLHLFEPAPASHKAISDQFSGTDNITIHQLALSDSAGVAQFHLVSPTGGTNSLVSVPSPATETIDVATSRAEDYIAGLGIEHIALMKIDTEGHDFAVLKGCERLLIEKRIAVVQFEYNHRWLVSGCSLQSVFDFAVEIGYRVGRASADRIDVYKDWNPENDRFFEWNYLLIAPDMVTALDCREVCWSEANTLVDL
jgi:FkbM family methyltransferase